MTNETCVICDCKTGKAGRDSDSRFICLKSGDELGPLCDTCGDQLAPATCKRCNYPLVPTGGITMDGEPAKGCVHCELVHDLAAAKEIILDNDRDAEALRDSVQLYKGAVDAVLGMGYTLPDGFASRENEAFWANGIAAAKNCVKQALKNKD